MKNLNKIQKLTFEFDEIESIEDIGYQECIDIEVKDDNSFTLANGIITHNSAQAGLVDGIGRAEIGYFATRGVPLNSYDAKIQKLTENKELENLIKILNIHLNAPEQNMTYENVLLANDADVDGGHIRGLYIGFFAKYAKSVILEKRLKLLQTPIVCLKDSSGKIKKMFFNLVDYKKFEKENTDKKLIPHYYKGLGSWKPSDLRELIKQYGLEYFIVDLEPDETSDNIIHKWLDNKEADSRKEMLRNHIVDLDKI